MRTRIVVVLAALTVTLAGVGGVAAAGNPEPPPGAMFAATQLVGANVVPGPGDPDGKGTVGINPTGRNTKICWGLEVKRLDAITGAYVHKGERGAAGAARVTLFENAAGLPGGGVHRGCVKHLDPGLVRRIIGVREESGRNWPWYVELRTTAYPAGAVRGQLGLGAPVEALPSGSGR